MLLRDLGASVAISVSVTSLKASRALKLRTLPAVLAIFQGRLLHQRRWECEASYEKLFQILVGARGQHSMPNAQRKATSHPSADANRKPLA